MGKSKKMWKNIKLCSIITITVKIFSSYVYFTNRDYLGGAQYES